MSDSCPICETALTGFYPPEKYDCPRCGEFILTGSLQAELPGKLSGRIHRRALMSHKLRRMARGGQPPPKISTYTVDSFWTNEVMPTPAEQADDLILWVGDNQLSPDYPLRAALYFLGAWVGTSLFDREKNPHAGISWLLAQPEMQILLIAQHEIVLQSNPSEGMETLQLTMAG
jgi:hypothetical protein